MILFAPRLHTRTPIRGDTAMRRFWAGTIPGASGLRSEIPTISIEGIKWRRSRSAVPPRPAPRIATLVGVGLAATVCSVIGCGTNGSGDGGGGQQALPAHLTGDGPTSVRVPVAPWRAPPTPAVFRLPPA